MAIILLLIFNFYFLTISTESFVKPDSICIENNQKEKYSVFLLKSYKYKVYWYKDKIDIGTYVCKTTVEITDLEGNVIQRSPTTYQYHSMDRVPKLYERLIIPDTCVLYLGTRWEFIP